MYAFIGGTPSAGKSYIAKKFIKESGLPIECVEIDSFRKNFAKNPELDKWVKVFSSKDELKYWNEITPEEHIKNLISQSEAFWPEIIKIINEVKDNSEHAIFEAVNLLPYLVHKDFDFPGFFLVEEDMETLLRRLNSNPKWGETPEKQQLEAKFFIEWEARYIRDEAEKYNYPVFNNEAEALKLLHKIFNKT
jgi:2-phosphoglycerate kinase